MTDATTRGSRVGGADRFAHLIVAARWWVVVFWLGAMTACLLFFPSFSHSGGGGGLKGILKADTPAVQTEKRAYELFGFPLIARTIVVQRNGDGLSPYAQARTVVRAVAVDSGKAGDVKPLLGALPITNTQGLFPGSSEASTTALTYLLFGPDASLGARTRAAQDYAHRFFTPEDHVVGVSGSAPARLEQGHIINDSLPTVEITTLLAIIVMVGMSFRSVAAPLIAVATAAISYLVTFRVAGVLTTLFDLPSPDELKPVVVALLLGVVTDYVVFFCSALRDEQRAKPSSSTRKVATRAIARSTPIVLVAGIAVAAGAATLLAAVSPFFRALGPALAFTVLVGLLVAITLVPALVAVFGDLVFWPSPTRPRGHRASLSARLLARTALHPRHGIGWPGAVVEKIAGRRSVAAIVLGVCVLGMLIAASPLLGLRLGVSFVGALPHDTSVRQAAASAQKGFAAGILSPTVVLVEGRDVGSNPKSLRQLGTALTHQPGVAGVLGPGSTPLPLHDPIFATKDRNAVRYLVVLDDDPLGANAVGTADRLRNRLPGMLTASGMPAARAALSGDSATASYVVHQTEQDLLRIALAAMVANALMLLIFLRALLASLLLLLTSLLSLSATLGIATAVFRLLAPGEGLTFYVPFAAAVLLLAFGSDYNIFTVGHVWESARSRSIRGAVVDALPRAVVAVTVAGLALATSFGLLGLVPLLPFRELAFTMAVGVLIDVFVVRSLLVPALLSLTGEVGAWPSRRLRKQVETGRAPTTKECPVGDVGRREGH